MINLFSPQEFAAGYALDILEEQAEFEGKLAAVESLPAELNTFELAVGELAYGVPSLPLPVDLKGRLFRDLEASTIVERNHPKSPLVNRPIKGDIRGATVGGKQR